MASKRGVDWRAPRPMVSVIIVPGVSSSKVNILMGADLLGRGYRPPVGSIGIHVRASDLVGLTPPSAALRCLEPLVRRLRHLVESQSGAAGPGAPLGATGGTVTQVPGQMLLPLGSP